MVTGAFLLALALPRPPGSVSLPALVIAIGLAYPALSGAGLRWHYYLIAAGWLAFAFVPRLNLSAHARDVGLDLLIGVSLIVAGIGDDRLIRRTLTPRKELYARSV
jgi:hypothetical protein